MQEEHSLFLFLFAKFFKPYLTLRKKPLNMAKTCANMKKKMLFFLILPLLKTTLILQNTSKTIFFALFWRFFGLTVWSCEFRLSIGKFWLLVLRNGRPSLVASSEKVTLYDINKGSPMISSSSWLSSEPACSSSILSSRL